MAEQPSSERKRKRGVFPRDPLKDAIVLAKTIYDLGEGQPVRRIFVFDELGKSPSSGSSRALVTAANSGYGLISGGYNANFLELTDRGKTIVSPQTSEFEKQQAIFDALFSNELFAGFVRDFQDKRVPIPQIAIDNLANKHGLSQADAKVCWEVFSQNMNDFGLVQVLSDKPTIVSRETALSQWHQESSAATTEPSIADNGVELTPALPQLALERESKHTQYNELQPQFHFNIQIQLPEHASPEDYDAIFKSIAVHLFNRGGD